MLFQMAEVWILHGLNRNTHIAVQTQLCLFQPLRIQMPLDVLLCVCESCQIDALIGLCFVSRCMWEAYSDRPLFCKRLHTSVISLVWIGLLGRKALEAFHFFQLEGVLVWKTDWGDSLLCLGHSLNRILFCHLILFLQERSERRELKICRDLYT